MRTSAIINRHNYILGVLLILLAAFLTYSAVYPHSFLITWDDSGYITDNPTVHGLSFAHIIDTFKSVVIGTYAPLHIGAYPEDPAAYVHLGRSYYLGENYGQSEKAYLEAVKRKPDLIEPIMALAEIYMKTGRPLQGEEMLRRLGALQSRL